MEAIHTPNHNVYLKLATVDPMRAQVSTSLPYQFNCYSACGGCDTVPIILDRSLKSKNLVRLVCARGQPFSE
jgi:hypothetical protein